MRFGVLYARPGPLWHIAAKRFRAWSLHPAARHVTAKFIADAHHRGWRVIPYTVNDPAAIARLRSLGADGIFTDFPDRAASA